MGSCYYCGRPATDNEHVIQKSILRSLQGVSIDLYEEVTKNRRLIVPSCGECNGLLVGTVQFTLAERKMFVKMRLRQKYAKLLAMPDWTDKELSEVEGHIRGHIINALREKQILKARLSW